MGSSAIPWTYMDINGHASIKLIVFQSNFIEWDHREYLGHKWTSTDMHRQYLGHPCHLSAAIPWTSKGHQWTSSNDDDDDVDDDDDGFDDVDDGNDGFDDVDDDDDGSDDIDDDDCF